MADPLRRELIARDAFVKSDNAFQRRARLLQCLWREASGLEAGRRNGKDVGSRINPGPGGTADYRNFLTETIAEVAKLELAEVEAENRRNVALSSVAPGAGAGEAEVREPAMLEADAVETSGDSAPTPAKPAKPAPTRWSSERLLVDLVASQPMMLNLVGELVVAPETFAKVLQGIPALRLSDKATVEAVELRRAGTKSPGFVDLLIEYTDEERQQCRLGFRVRYTENFRVGALKPEPEWNRIAGGISKEFADELVEPPLQQVWIDYLALREIAAADGVGADRVRFVQVHPGDNFRAQDVAYRFNDFVGRGVEVVTLEEFVGAIEAVVDEPWVTEFRERYLGFEVIDELLESEVAVEEEFDL